MSAPKILAHATLFKVVIINIFHNDSVSNDNGKQCEGKGVNVNVAL